MSLNEITVFSPPRRRDTLAGLLARSTPSTASLAAQARTRRQLVMPALAVAAVMLSWAAIAPLSGAVIAAGEVQTAMGRKPVSHQEGGIVRELRVREGQVVRRGDALLVVGDVRSDASLDLMRRQQAAERVREARARAELVLAAHFDAPMAADDAGARERALFDARRQALDAQLAALGAQRREARTRLQALEAQHAAADRAAALARDELAMQQELLAAGFVQRGRLIGFERAAHDALARVEAARGQVSEVQQQLAQLTGQEAQARSAYQQRAADELEDAGRRLRELDERLRPSEDQVGRQVVRAPADGTVMSLRVGAVGTAVGPRETLLEIAPSDETLVVEALVAPRDIDHVVAGGAAEVRLAPYDARRTAPLPALVAHVAPDAERDESGMAWYRARLEIGAEALAAQPGLRLQAGMPAEVFVSTAPRSLLAYLLEPLGLFAGRAMREP